MELSALHSITLVITIGIIAQVVAARYKTPSIIVLLLCGFLCGPVWLDVINPDDLLGKLLFPMVSISVAIILFEGGLSLKFKEIPGVRAVIFKLISIGALVTWFGASFIAWKVLELEFVIASLLGAILTVSGPTVVLPILRVVRPKAPLGEILKWEGILIDPVGALLAFLVFEIILVGNYSLATEVILIGLFKTITIGGVCGALGAWLLSHALYRQYIADYLESIMTLGTIVFIFSLSDFFAKESGLVAVTLMGMMLANSKKINVHHILEFKENLRHLLISVLFILLSARIGVQELEKINIVGSLITLASLIFIIRPMAVLCSTFNSELKLKEKIFLSFLAPRGIVAAAVASLFALELIKEKVPDAELLVPYTFIMIVGTVVFYSVVSPALARILGLSDKTNEGILFMGANELTRTFAKIIQNLGFPVMLVDTNFRNVGIAKMAGLPAFHGNILSEQLLRKLSLDGIGRFIAMTPNNDANSLGALRLSDYFGKHEVYQLPDSLKDKEEDTENAPKHLMGKILNCNGKDFYYLDEIIYDGGKIKVTPLTSNFNFKDLKNNYKKAFVPLAILRVDNKLELITQDIKVTTKPGDKIISLILE